MPQFGSLGLWPAAPLLAAGLGGADNEPGAGEEKQVTSGTRRAGATAAITMAMVFSAAAFAGELPAAASSPAAGGAALLRDGFEDGLSGWEQAEGAEFVLDKDQRHGGAQSARLTNAADVKIHYQQLQRAIKGVTPGDRILAQIWVRTKDVTDGAGAYMALEFLGAGGQRLDIAHSKVSRTTGKDGWEQLSAEAIVPKATVAAKMLLIFHAHGTAWFDDAEVELAEKPAAWPDLGGAERAVVIRAKQVVSPRFGGVGFHVFDHAHTASRQLLDEVIEKRWRELNPLLRAGEPPRQLGPGDAGAGRRAHGAPSVDRLGGVRDDLGPEGRQGPGGAGRVREEDRGHVGVPARREGPLEHPVLLHVERALAGPVGSDEGRHAALQGLPPGLLRRAEGPQAGDRPPGDGRRAAQRVGHHRVGGGEHGRHHGHLRRAPLHPGIRARRRAVLPVVPREDGVGRGHRPQARQGVHPRGVRRQAGPA